jgi:hypothetical protein
VTGYRSSYFRHDCAGEAGCYVRTLPSWDDLIECFPRGIRPTDVDGMVEINGHVLFLEQKQAGAHLQEGQRRAFLSLAEHDGVTVVVFRPGRRSELEVLILDGTPPVGYQPVDRAWLTDWLRGWAQAADSADRPRGARVGG